jgi:hypothetical protein
MATKEEQRYRSATWWDVRVYCLEVGKAHNGYVTFIASPNTPERTNHALVWTAAWWPRGRAPSEGYTVGVTGYFPCNDYKTVPDLLMNMIYQLDWKLTEREASKLRQSAF